MPNRLIRICLTRFSSPRTTMGIRPSSSRRKVRCFWVAVLAKIFSRSCRNSWNRISDGSSRSLPASIFATSSSPSINDNRCELLRMMVASGS
ncbi:hypothetical protein D3C73_1364680 [compost metagenome]